MMDWKNELAALLKSLAGLAAAATEAVRVAVREHLKDLEGR